MKLVIGLNATRIFFSRADILRGLEGDGSIVCWDTLAGSIGQNECTWEGHTAGVIKDSG